MLWWKVHERDAPELEVEPRNQTIFDRGTRIGDIARTYVPGGVLIDLPYQDVEGRVAATARALAEGAPVIYEASFLQDGVFVAIDILERTPAGFVLAEVKSTASVKEQHLSDVAIQLHVARRAGLTITRAEVMHLNSACRFPDLSNLFVRNDVTDKAMAQAPAIPGKIRSLLVMLQRGLPDTAPGNHCTSPYACAFIDRCVQPLPEHHVSTLYRIRREKITQLEDEGFKTLFDLPSDFPAKGPAKRQIRSVRRSRLIVERCLADVLAGVAQPIAFIDFETVSPPVPVWNGCGPYMQVPVQLSCHVRSKPGLLEHREWLADGPTDPREAFARALLRACDGAKTILAYGASFERRCIAHLINAVPHLAAELTALHDRIEDLLPVVRDHVYHPDFHGSFSIKDVLPALIPTLGYDDLDIQDGETASAALEALLLTDEPLPSTERHTMRQQLLQYCERDTLAMVRLYERLVQLAHRRS